MPGEGRTRGGDDALAADVAEDAPLEEDAAGAPLSALGSAIERTAEGSSGVLVSSADRGAAFDTDAADVDDVDADAAASAPPARTSPMIATATGSFDRGEDAPTIDTGIDAVTGIAAIDACDDAP